MLEISAGGVVYRGTGNELRIQLIQDRFGKITLAKGKMEPGETVEQTALREIDEETGITGSVVCPLETIHYTYGTPDSGPVDKEVHYFLVEATGGDLHAQIEEISGVEWVSPQEAWQKQLKSGYYNNNAVLRKALEQLGYGVEL
jgi:8-oxo-dGTP pyrophosphatase MutT (NUDIX family)